MATKTLHGTEPASEPEPLPVDLLLEIVARSNVTTVVRCAAACKNLRGAILDPAFARRRFALLEAESCTGAVFDDFDPSLLLGVSYPEPGYLHGSKCPLNTIQFCARRLLLDDDSSFSPVAAHDGLLVLRHYRRLDVLRVRDVFTGHPDTLLPPPAIREAYAPHVLLSAGSSSRFELLIADSRMSVFQTFSSVAGQWSAVRQATKPRHPGGLRLDTSRNPAVIGRIVYWLFSEDAILPDRILALDIDSAEATMVALPPRCLSSMMMAIKKGDKLLLACVRGRPSLLVSESHGISMWTRAQPAQSEAASWSRQAVICRAEVERQGRRLGLGLASRAARAYLAYGTFRLEGIGERSGAVILQLVQGELLRLDLGTKAVSRLREPAGTSPVKRVFLHEMDLVSLFRSMKSV